MICTGLQWRGMRASWREHGTPEVQYTPQSVEGVCGIDRQQNIKTMLLVQTMMLAQPRNIFLYEPCSFMVPGLAVTSLFNEEKGVLCRRKNNLSIILIDAFNYK